MSMPSCDQNPLNQGLSCRVYEGRTALKVGGRLLRPGSRGYPDAEYEWIAAQAIRCCGNEKKSLVRTANVFQEDCEKAIESDMKGHIAKPVDAIKMLGVMEKVLQGSR